MNDTATTSRARRTVALASIAAMILSLTVLLGAQQASAATCHPYPDVDSSNPACENIAWLKAQGITKPADGLYHPLNSVTRGSMAAFLFRLVNSDLPRPACDSKPFVDVLQDSTFCGYIQWAKNNGIAYGYSDGSYGASNPVTRGAMAAYLSRIANSGYGSPACTERPFDDVAMSATFCRVITWMVANGITYGVGGGKYGTTLNVTRQAMASFLHRISALIGTDVFSQGTFRVGVDVKPGLYRAKVPSGTQCVWERRSNSGTSAEGRIDAQGSYGYALIKIKSTDHYVRSGQCGIWHPDSGSAAWPLHGTIPGDGAFVVGKDVAPGVYRQSGSNCRVEFFTAATGDFGDLTHVWFGGTNLPVEASDKILTTTNCSTFTGVG